MLGVDRGGCWCSAPVPQNEAREAEAAAEGVFDVFGEDAVDRVGLVAREAGEAAGGAVGFRRELQNVLHDAEEAGVEGDTVGEGLLAIAADDAAAGGGERSAGC